MVESVFKHTDFLGFWFYFLGGGEGGGGDGKEEYGKY